jgi:membrane protein YqaA with SNARE-associated domain
MWLEEMAGRPYALVLLFLVAFVEASVAPVPPDLLFLPLALAKPRRSFIPASVCIIGSVSGAVLGYFIGMEFYATTGIRLLDWSGSGKHFGALLETYHENGFITLLLAGFTNIPFFVFAITAGFKSTLSLSLLLAGAAAGRALRFYLLALLIFFFGPVVKRLLERHLVAFSFGFLGLFIAVILLSRVLS